MRLFDPAVFAAQLDAARLGGNAIAPPPEFAALALSDAYAIQDALAERRARAGDRRSGWKLGLTSWVKQERMGIERPVFGRLFSSGAVAGGAGVPAARFVRPRIEPEVAFGLAGALDPTIEIRAQLQNVAWFAPALEVTDSRYLPGDRTAVELVADNTSAGAYIIGAHCAVADTIDATVAGLAGIGVTFMRNGTVVATGMTGDVLGDPLEALGFLMRHLADRGAQTAAGDIVLSGAITDALDARSGDAFEVRFDRCATAAVTFE